MKNLSEITAAAALMLFAHISLAQLISNNSNLINLILPKSKRIRDYFNVSGLWHAIKPGGKEKLERLWGKDGNYHSGFDPAVHGSRILDKLKQFKPDLPIAVERAIIETMINVNHHAYLNSPIPFELIEKRWWHRTTLRQDELNFIIYDRGVGFAETFKKPELIHLLPVNPISVDFDREMILHAMKKGVSCTGDKWRGKGSGDITKLTELYPGIGKNMKSLLILSNRGYCGFPSLQKPDELHTFSLDSKVSGTLIEISIDLNG